MEWEVKTLLQHWPMLRGNWNWNLIKNRTIDDRGDGVAVKSSYVRVWFVVVFAVFLVVTLWMVSLETCDPYLLTSAPWTEFFSYEPRPENKSEVESVRVKSTYIRGNEAVDKFQSRLACFSESGRWMYDPTPRHLPWNSIGDRYATTCDFRHMRSGTGYVSGDQADEIAMEGEPGDWLIRDELKWVWQTNSSCPFRPVNRDDFCKRVGSGRNVLVVGDSINHEISWSFMNHLVLNGTGYVPLSSNDRIVDDVYEMCGDIFGGGNGFKVFFVRNDRLSPVLNQSVDTWHNFYEFPWLNLLYKHDVRLVLMNRGAHYEEDWIYAQSLRNIFSILSEHFPHLQVIFRNTPPGHVNCTSYLKPLDERQHEDNPNVFHWGDFYRQNQIAAKIVQEFQYIYMDVDTMLSLRPDGHISNRDCLHYCLPGPLDLAVQYLYNILLLL